MILARKIKLEETETSKNILLQYDIDYEYKEEDVVYVLLSDEKVIGVCKVVCDNNRGELKYIVIDKEEVGQDFGDALLRATFNHCLINSVKTIYFNHINEYLVKKGFEEKDSKLLEIDLESFFNKPCKSSGGR